MCTSIILFAIYTAPPDIYTYLPTLPLHRALPVSLRCGRGPAGRSAASARTPGDDQTAGVRAWCARPTPPTARARRTEALAPSRGSAARERRSEEHTSELQSLMRISYAVFCLKKKKTNTHR